MFMFKSMALTNKFIFEREISTCSLENITAKMTYDKHNSYLVCDGSVVWGVVAAAERALCLLDDILIKQMSLYERCLGALLLLKFSHHFKFFYEYTKMYFKQLIILGVG